MIKKIALTLLSLFLVSPCVANIHIDPKMVVAVIKEMVPADKVNATITSYNTQLKASRVAGGGAAQGISANRLWNVCAAAGWDIKKPAGKQSCQKFVTAMVKKATVNFVAACDDDKKGKGGNICVDNFFTNKVYGGTQVKMQNAIALSLEYIRIKYNDTQVQCRNKANKRGLDYGVLCVSRDKNASYELIFDDVEESKDKTIQDSIQSAICRMYDAKPTTAGCGGGGTNVSGTSTCWEASCAASSAKCTNINQSMAKFGYAAIYKNNKCEINFNVIRKKEDLKTAYGIDNFVFCKGIQVSNAPNVETYIKQYVSGIAKVPVNSVVCSKGFNTYTGPGCSANGMTDLKDDIIRCSVGNNHIDFVFDDVNEAFKTTSDGGVQGMSCIVSGGAYSGERCIGLGEQQCNVLRQSNLKNCPECKAVKWDKKTQSCILPSSQSAQNLQKGINVGIMVGLTVAGVVITVATGGAAGAPVATIVFTGIETVGAGIEITSQLKINGIADDFLVESNKCKKATCAKEMLKQNLQRMANYYNDMTTAEANAVDSELARLADLIPDNDDMWAEILVKGTDMQSNQKGLFDIDSWEPEQVWRAVGIGLQLASVVSSVGKWLLKKTGRLAKSTAKINAKFTAAVDSVDRAQEGTLTKNRLALKRTIVQKRAAGTIDNLDETEVAWRELYRKYAPRDQSLNDFKAMVDGNIEEMQQMSKNWISWDDPLGQAESRLLETEAKLNDFWRNADPEVTGLMLDNPKEFAKQYPEIVNLQADQRQMEDILVNGFTGNFTTFNPDLKSLKKSAQQNITLQKSMTNTEVNMLRKRGYSEKEIDGLYRDIVDDTRKYTTDNVLRETAERVTISQLDDVALLRADQMHDIIESDSWLKSQKQNWYSLTTDEKRQFAQEVSNKLLYKNGVPNSKATEVRAAKLEIGNTGSYNKHTNVTKIDFDQVQDYESFINVLAHENGGHAIDNLNSNAGALGSQLQDATHDLYGATYDAYRAKPTEQTSWRIGDFASVVNSYDNSDLTDVLLDAVDLDKRIQPYDIITGRTIDYKALGYKSPVSALWDDLFGSKTSIALEIRSDIENADDILDVLKKSGRFEVRKYTDGSAWSAIPIK